MKKIELNKQEQELLKTIMEDKYSKGPFCGMIYQEYRNLQRKSIDRPIEELIQQALQVRLIAESLANLKEKSEPSIGTSKTKSPQIQENIMIEFDDEDLE